MTKRLDEIDISILDNLQKNGRMTNVELANRAGISAPPCLRRLKNLEDSGVIVGYHAEINRNLIGYNFLAICLVSLINQNQKHVDEFINYIQKLPNIRECISITGDFDYILRILTKDLSDYERLLNIDLKSCENIGQIKTYVAIKDNKCENGVPLKQF